MKSIDNSTKPSSVIKDNCIDGEPIPSFLKALTSYQSDDPIFSINENELLNDTFSKSSGNFLEKKSRFSNISSKSMKR